MYKKRETFRKAALERLANPERLDEMMQITSPKGWIALVSCGVMLLLALLWSVFGRIPERVLAQGILIPGGSLMQVESTTNGRIVEFLVEVGDLVEADQPLARINVEGADFDLDLLNQRLDRLTSADKDFRTKEERELQDEQARLKVDRASLEAERAAKANELTTAQGRLGRLEDLLKKGAVAGAVVGAERVKVQTLAAELKSVESRFSALTVEETRLQSRIFEQRSGREQELAEAKDQIKKVSRDKEKSAQVKSPFSGRVTEIPVAEGARVSEQDVVIRLERLDSELKALLFVPSKPGKKVEVKHIVHISPSTVKKEEFGSILAKVSDKRTQPATPAGMLKDLGNQSLVEEFSSFGAPLRLEATLEVDAKTHSGYRWTSGKGPPIQIFSGTPCMAAIIVDEKRPIDFVIPFFKEFFLG